MGIGYWPNPQSQIPNPQLYLLMSSKQKQEQPDPLELKRQQEEQEKKRLEKLESLKIENERRKRNEEVGKKVLQAVASKKNSNMGYYFTFGIAGLIVAYIFAMILMGSKPNLSKMPVIDESIIEEHNSHTSWKQGTSRFFEGLTMQDAKNLISVHFSNSNTTGNCESTVDDIPIPENFDVRDQWKTCILPVENQGQTCASYGLSVAQTISERECIQSVDKKVRKYSGQELLSCDTNNKGCLSGHLNISLDYAKLNGLVEEECFPYVGDNNDCSNKCPEGKNRKIKSYCMIYNEDNIKREILVNGPVLSVTQVHIDFLNYKSGIYRVTPGTAKFAGYHAIKIVGWGVDKEQLSPSGDYQKYWIVQNSWSEDWGENGYAKIAMYQELFFEKFAFAVQVGDSNRSTVLEEVEQV